MATNTVTLLHTAEVHRVTFSALRDAIAPDTHLVQHVYPTWLVCAQEHGVTSEIEADIQTLIQESVGPVICTCTTLGAVAEQLGAIRVDRPMMEAAAKTQTHILVVFAVESTRKPTLSLLDDCIKTAETKPNITPLCLDQYWPLFTQGRIDEFRQKIVDAISLELGRNPDIETVVLAQVSMAGAADLLQSAKANILSSPQIALEYVLSQSKLR